MIQKITYENKISIMNDEEIPIKNKVTDNDLNEIKQVVNTNADELDKKVDKVEGKELSTNDYTNVEKEKLESLQNYDDTEIRAKITQNTINIESIQTEQTEQNTSIQNLRNEDIQIKERLELCEKNQIHGNESGTIIAIDDATKCSATLNCSATAQLTKCATNMLDSQKLYEKMKSIVSSTIIEIVEDVQAIKFSNAGFYNSRLIEKRFKENTSYTFKFRCQGPARTNR